MHDDDLSPYSNDYIVFRLQEIRKFPDSPSQDRAIYLEEESPKSYLEFQNRNVSFETSPEALEAVCATHQKEYGYDKETAERMAELGEKTTSEKGETPYDYLTRLYETQSKQGFIQAQAQLDDKKKLLQKAQQEQTLWLQTPGWYGTITSNFATSNIAVKETLERVDKKPLEIPDPVEPKKRFMQR
jgi:hypothetical protein